MERVLALDRETGRTLWTHEYPADYGDMDHGNGPRATPAIHGGRVFSLGAVGRLVCLDEAAGKPIWSVDLAKTLNAKLPTWGHSASPLVAGELLLVQAGARPGGTLVGLDLRDGSERWRALGDRPGYSSPILIGPAGQEEVVLWTADAVHGLDPASGKPRWEFPFKTSEYDVAIISPVFQEGQVLVSGYWDGTRAFSVGSGSPPRLAWTSRVPSCLMATPLYRERVLYALDRKDGLLCLEWKTGKVLWSDGHRLTAKGQNPHASMVWAGGERAAMVNAEGELVLARLSPKGYQELGRVPIIRPTCWAHPAFSGQEVFARNDEELVCVRVKQE
jgi:outer membrane protein assembly factor BamB